MTSRDRFLRLFQGQPVDKVPFGMFMGVARGTLDRWAGEGLDVELDSANPESYRDANRLLYNRFEFDASRGLMLPVNGFICPEFPETVVGRKDDFNYVQTKWGGMKRVPHTAGRMALMETPAVTDRASWERLRERLQLETKGRLPGNWQEICETARDPDMLVYAGDLPIGFYGGPRELLGTEGLCTIFYDDPALINEILDTLCNLWIEFYSRIYTDAPFDYFFIWEDMCYKNGPLISPGQFREFLLPRYKRFISALRDLGVPLVMVDSDGDTRKLVPLWQEAGVDITFPWETQYGLDIRTVRRAFPTVGILGGLNKTALAFGRGMIDDELDKAAWLAREGRCIPWLDHEVPPEVPWEAFEYFCRRLKDVLQSTVPKSG